VTYKDKNDAKYQITRWGFLIEDEEELAKRLAAEECKECMGQPAENFHKSLEKIQSVFQYMIGNTDWSLQMNRNVKLLKNSEEKLIPIPYDFDFSVMVGAPYMRPNSDVKQTGKMERVFMGNSGSAKELYSTFAYFKSKKEAMLEVIRNFRLLNEDTRVEMLNYLESFFEIIMVEDLAQRTMFSGNG
jgi:hypothetical protein